MDIERLEKILATQKVKSKKLIYISSLTIALLAAGTYNQQDVSADQVNASETSKVQAPAEEIKENSDIAGSENDEQRTSATTSTTQEDPDPKQLETDTPEKDAAKDTTVQGKVKESAVVDSTSVDNNAKTDNANDNLVEQKRDDHWYLINETTGQQMTGF